MQSLENIGPFFLPNFVTIAATIATNAYVVPKLNRNTATKSRDFRKRKRMQLTAQESIMAMLRWNQSMWSTERNVMPTNLGESIIAFPDYFFGCLALQKIL